MALVDVSELIIDPDFADVFIQIKRAYMMTNKGRMDLTDTPFNRVGVIQDIDGETLKRFPEAAEFYNGIKVWCQSKLEAEAPGGYGDVVVWNGDRYLVKIVDQNFMNFGPGWTSALCSKEVPNG